MNILNRLLFRLTVHCRFRRQISVSMIKRTQIKKVLCVAEKNDAAKGIAEIMSNGRSRRREGYSVYNKIYEYEYNLFGQNVTVSMTSVSGHLLGLEFKAPFQKWHSCNPVLLFDAEVEKYCPDNFVPIKRTLEREVKQCQALVIWTDCDREGENIGFEIINVCKAGASFTRFQTLRLQKIFPESLSDQLISYGSCQFPTLGFVVERFKAIQAFVPETFFKIKVVHEPNEEESVEFGWKRHRLFNHTACLVLYQMCMEDPIANVISVTSKPKSKWRPLPLDTVELEKLASRKLRISAKETMKIAEKLYTQGFISYPRTETNMFPQNLNLTPLVEQQTQDNEWGNFAQRILDSGGPTPRNGNKSDQAHPPIHPTKYTNSLQGNEKRLYEFIVRHFLACCSKDAQGQEVIVEIEIAQERFSASGLTIIARNYLEVYPYDKWYNKVIPLYEPNTTFQPTAIEMVEGQTSPPQLLTEADLISLMEKHGIGTDATHAEHIETIKSRMYVGLTADQRFLPGELGMGLVEGYNSMGYEMSKPDLRAELEADLKLVSEGRKDKASVLSYHVAKYKAVFIESVRKAKKLDEALSNYLGPAQEFTEQEQEQLEIPLPVRKCPQCNRDMVLKKKKDSTGMFLSCMGYPACKAAVWFPGTVLEVSRDESVCPTCRPPPVHMLKFKFKRGSLPPMMPLEFVGCIGGCDETLREVLNLKYLRGGDGDSSSRMNNNLTSHQPRVQRTNSAPPSRVENSRPPAPRPRADSNRPTASLPPLQPPAQDGAIVCNCGLDAVLLTVRKDGPNQGRQFYKCNTGDCKFFLWADQPAEQGAPGGSRGPLNQTSQPPRPSVGFGNVAQQQQNNRGSGSNEGETMCNCNEPAVTRTVMKDGPNKGRMFHTCGKPRDQQCGFFQWANENVPPATDFPEGNNGNRGGNKKTSAVSNKPPAAKRQRTCGTCHEPGHTRVTCPHGH
ncbi:putative DNA topoisomerase 3-alpha [Triplophysa rosa]|uniref:DNA topoisomerase n=1 Tax=Triplophysa rosa TaxID=992332 RepID=A0A9W7WMA8_TRIRA|nr:putative DNA topoisomerase 3-alpha [Triplophysa rosa]